jgi:hypothetical protein
MNGMIIAEKITYSENSSVRSESMQSSNMDSCSLISSSIQSSQVESSKVQVTYESVRAWTHTSIEMVTYGDLSRRV